MQQKLHNEINTLSAQKTDVILSFVILYTFLHLFSYHTFCEYLNIFE